LTGELDLDFGVTGEQIIGYAAYFMLINGFERAEYWTKEEIIEHAGQYSQAYRAKKQDSPWFSNFDAMALKTVLKSLISHWAPKSIQMQKAILADQGVIETPDGSINYPESVEPVIVTESKLVPSQPTAPATQPKARRRAAAQPPVEIPPAQESPQDASGANEDVASSASPDQDDLL
jgi:recombinational DNA repair protein RecT